MNNIYRTTDFFLQKILLKGIKFYQKYISADHGGFLEHIYPGGVCRFDPTCSEYTAQAISKYGSMKGLILGLKRFSKCHPFSKGGHDPLK
jgi:uncharacterized protein